MEHYLFEKKETHGLVKCHGKRSWAKGLSVGTTPYLIGKFKLENNKTLTTVFIFYFTNGLLTQEVL